MLFRSLTRTPFTWCSKQKYSRPQNEFRTRTRFTKHDARAGEARRAGGAEGVHVDSFSSHSLSGSETAHLISWSNSPSTSSMELNFIPQSFQAAIVDVPLRFQDLLG